MGRGQNGGYRRFSTVGAVDEATIKAYQRPETRDQFYRHVLEEARRLPGVTAAGFTSFLPIAMGGGIWPVEIAGHPEDLANRETASLRFVTPGFFAAMGIPLLDGRDVQQRDSHTAALVALVSASFVRRYWAGEIHSATALISAITIARS
jgi:hypothetical protein